MITKFYGIFNRHKELLLALLFLWLVNIAIYHVVYFNRLYPYPGDLLVSFFFPWSGGGFTGFNQWTTNKEWNGADAIRQMLPWKEQIINSLRSGQLPLWNPFNFSGSPLLANLQSAVFYPGTIVLLLLPLLQGWTLEIIATPIILGIGCYLYFRSENFSFSPSIIGAVIFSNISYITVWQEVQVVMQSVIVLPFILLLINKKRVEFIPILLAISIFGGHIQTAMYVYFITIAFLLYRKISLFKLTAILIISLAIASIQLIPSVELYLNSAREGEASKRLFTSFILPWKHLVTAWVPDFFGNPATRNFWSDHYGERQVYVGAVALLLAVLGLVTSHKDKLVRLVMTIGIIGIVFSTSPGAYLFPLIHFPILSTSMPARTIFLLQFSIVFLAVVGMNHLLGKEVKLKKTVLSIGILTIFYVGILASTLLLHGDQRTVAIKNSVLPVATFILASSSILTFQIFKTRYFTVSKMVLVIALLLFATFEYSYWFNKYHPFSPPEFFFPKHPILETLQSKAGINRFHGNSAAHLDKNFATYYGIYSSEGYDPLYIKRYGEFIASAKDGTLQVNLQRSDADLNIEELPVSQSYFKDRAMNLLGIKYLTEKNEDPLSDWDPNFHKFSAERFNLVWQKDKWKIYERRGVLGRVILFDAYVFNTDPAGIINTFYDKNFPYDQTVILEDEPKTKPQIGGQSDYHLKKYSPSEIILDVDIDKPKILFISDAYYPGWRASVNGTEEPIIRANYAFRAVALKAGNNDVRFYYDPLSMKIGIALTIIGLIVCIYMIYTRDKK